MKKVLAGTGLFSVTGQRFSRYEGRRKDTVVLFLRACLQPRRDICLHPRNVGEPQYCTFLRGIVYTRLEPNIGPLMDAKKSLLL